MVGFEKALRAVKVIKDQIQCRSQRLLNLARGYFSWSERYRKFISHLKLSQVKVNSKLPDCSSLRGGHFHINLYGRAAFQGIIFQHKIPEPVMKIDQKF